MKNDSQLKNDANRGPYANLAKDKKRRTENWEMCLSIFAH